jgi:hypothetical protein
MSFHLAAAPQAATGGVLFNRKDPRNADGEIQPILNRRLEPRDGVRNPVFNDGKDFTSLDDRHKWKYRIPADSVVNKVGDCKLGLCFGWRLTAAQWIWVLNLICFAAHTAMVFLTAYFAWWSKDLDKYGDVDPYDIKIYRITAEWTNQTNQAYTFKVEENGMPVNVAWATLSFFLISAVFHLFALVAGLFEHTWFWYWRQLDDCFAYWRWIECKLHPHPSHVRSPPAPDPQSCSFPFSPDSASASLMGMLLAISVGIREQNTLALIFVSFWVTMMLGLMTELYSRPVIIADQTNYKTPVGRLGFIEKPDYVRNPNALHLLSQNSWEGERPTRDADGKPVPSSNFDFLHAQRVSNYVRRMLPHILGIFPFTAAMVVIIYHLEYAKWRLRTETDLRMPWFVDALIYGSLMLFSSFTFVQWIYQYLPPGYYFGTEICYCVLSLVAKMWLGWLMLVNVIMTEGRAEDALGGGALEQAR